MESDPEIRAITADEVDQWVRTEAVANGMHDYGDELPLIRAIIPPERSLAVVDGADIVGTATSYPLEMSVPGGSLHTAGVAWVAVLPTHRRRGLLRRMMRRQLDDIHEWGEALAALWPSETLIYGRYGYGTGSFRESWRIERPHTTFAGASADGGALSMVTAGEARTAFPEVYERVAARRTGMTRHAEEYWDRILADLRKPVAAGSSSLYYVAYPEHGQMDGYAIYRIREGTVVVLQLMPVTDAAHGALWRYCFGIDLTSVTEAHSVAVDDPLPWMLADPRRLRRHRTDAMWLRLVDVRAALSGRCYTGEGKLVLEVRDDFCTWNTGRYELIGGPDGTQCRASQSRSDITLSAADLATAYLGTTPFRTLHRAGRITARSTEAVRLADAMFASPRAPWCPNDF